MRSCFLVFCFVGLVALLLLPGLAQAHRMDLFVYVDGAVLHGEAAYVPSGAPQEGHVRISTPDGETLAELPLESDGTFRYQTPVRCDLTIEVDTPDAHRGTYTLSGEELPSGLPAWEPGASLDSTATGDEETMAEEHAHPHPHPHETAPADPSPTPAAMSEIEAAIERAVKQQSSVLRNEIARIEQHIRFRDILGGIGYIVGIAGLLAYLKYKPQRSGD